MDVRVSSGFNGPVAKIPTPPAFETAATSSGVEIHDIPGSTIGTLQLKSLVIRVPINDDDEDTAIVVLVQFCVVFVNVVVVGVCTPSTSSSKKKDD
jgi:hypothetical protein